MFEIYVIATTAVSMLMPKIIWSILDYEVDLCCWSSGAVSGEAVCTPVLFTGLYSCPYSSLGADPFTVLFRRVVES